MDPKNNNFLDAHFRIIINMDPKNNNSLDAHFRIIINMDPKIIFF